MQEQLKIFFETPAFKKSCLHTVKYFASDVIGVLTGEIKENTIKIQNAYPLFHSRVLAPMLEVAFDLVESQLAGKNEKIIGIYESLVKPFENKSKISDIATKILEKISEKNEILEPIFVKIQENKDDEYDEDEGGFVKSYSLDITIGQFQKIGNNKVFSLEKHLEKQLDFYDIFSEIEKNSHRKLVDFDNHLEDCSLSFLNDFIN